MHYFIDGYNLLFRILRASDDIALKRKQIIQDISSKAHLLKLDVTIVFDSHYYPGESERTHFGDLEIIFSAEGESADQLILDRIDNAKQTVVTSDKKLASLARRKTAKTETVEDFIAWLQRRYRNKLKQLKQPKLIKEKTVPKPPARSQQPSSSASIDEAFDYYLSIFEASIEQHSSIPNKQKKERALSEFERWMKAFSRRLKEEDGA